MCRFLIVACLVVLTGSRSLAWGPHSEITAAALSVLPEKPAIEKYLGPEFKRLAHDYCWMGDWQEAVRPDHYADDYLLFPSSPRHVSHMHPHVRKTYSPFFRRSLQAIRTESPQNAARWVGSLLHFVQDAGSPPHTTGIGGALHGKMERWVDESKLTLDGYTPRLLGKSEEEAERGFEERMAGLHDFSRQRAERLRPLVEKLEQRENQPLELECALEVARVSADLVHTLFTLGLKPPRAPGGNLEGSLNAPPPEGYATVLAKVLIEGTDYSTTADAEGRFRFRNLPPGPYTVWILATGYEAECVKGVRVAVGETTKLEPKLGPDAVAGNLIRNPKFAARWILAVQPDGWTRDPVKPGRSASAPIRVPVGHAVKLHIAFAGDKHPGVSLRWRSNPSSVAESKEMPVEVSKLPAEFGPDPSLKPFEKGFLFVEVLLRTEHSPEKEFRHVAITLSKK